MKEILSLHEADAVEMEWAGAKAARLASMYQVGFPVPTGLILGAPVFRRALSPYAARLERATHPFLQSRPDWEAASQASLAIIQSLKLPQETLVQLESELYKLGLAESILAVRSSASDEDQPKASLTGQYHTTLGVCGISGLKKAILTGWRAAFSPHVLAARAAANKPILEAGLAILIQPVLNAESAGVCYSVDPVNYDTGLSAVNAVWGLGTGVVEGTHKTDTYWVKRQTLKSQQRLIALKETQVGLAALKKSKETCLQESPLSVERQQSACLPEAWVTRIVEFGLALEQYFGAPQEVEWVIAGDQIWILQSRPVASLPEKTSEAVAFPVAWHNEADRKRLWRLSQASGREGAPAPLLPLELDTMMVSEGTRLETCLYLGANRNQEIKVFNGRPYFSPLPLPISPADQQIRQSAHEDLQNRLEKQGVTAWDHWGPEIEQATRRLHSHLKKVNELAFDGPEPLPPGELWADLLEEALAVYRRHIFLHPFFWFKPRPSFFEAYRQVSGQGGSDVEAVASRLIISEDNPLTRLIEWLHAIALKARRFPSISTLILEAPNDILNKIAALPEAHSFLNALEDFLEVFGERNGAGYGSEATICTPTWAECPEQVLSLLVPYLVDKGLNPGEARQQAKLACAAQVETLYASCLDPLTAFEFRRAWDYSCRTLAVLELHNHFIDQLAIGQLRLSVLAAARYLTFIGLLSSNQDIFWLTYTEIIASLRAPKPAPLKPLIGARQVSHQAWSQMQAPLILGQPLAQLPPRPPLYPEVNMPEPDPGSLLQGVGASQGKAKGRARLVKGGELLTDLQPGEILVAENLGPLWTPLFPILGGLVLEGGSLGQHAVSTAREYRVPAVVSTPGATSLIPEGAWVSIDGESGMVSLEECEG